MRKTALKESKNLTLHSVQSYHNGNWSNDGSYAAEGFEGYEAGHIPYFASDRTHTVTFDGLKVGKDGTLSAFNPMAYGLEIETGCDGIIGDKAYATVLKNVLFPIFPKGMFKLQHDGSLSGKSSAELITGLLTKEAIRNNYPNFKKMFNEFMPLFSIGADAAHGCGMHVNVSRGLFGKSEESQTETAKKLCYFINRNFELCKKLFAREGDCYYCSQIDRFTTWDGVDRYFEDFTNNSSHGICLNLGHWEEGSGRLEIRLVGGQKRYGTFRNTMEVIFFLIPRLIKLSRKDIDDMEKVFSGCNRYVMDRLSTMCADFFTPSQLQAIRNTMTDEEYF